MREIGRGVTPTTHQLSTLVIHLKGILHIKVCLKVLGSTTAYMRKKYSKAFCGY